MNEMTNGDVADLVKRSEKSSYLLGQVSGQLHTIMQLEGEHAIKNALQILFKHVLHSVEKIHYQAADERN